ncbi:hypothetical protein OIU79_028009 [Salix purpurea]|uniref:Uncharacterized protein n=1 Tax=Salix purpurea TaxID=77065 RepID=A0A9Q0VVJ6_SALPP|nr:hypothetical protein OIU79_028009 [Salix purpurea]
MKSQVELKIKIEVAAGPSPKAVALKIAQDLMATWIILDRSGKEDSTVAKRLLETIDPLIANSLVLNSSTGLVE